MSVLSEWDIINEMGRGLFFHPFKGKDQSIRGGCLCLTASKYAYAFSEDSSGHKKTESLRKQDSSGKTILILPPRRTSVVWTNESVFIDNYLCGSIHSIRYRLFLRYIPEWNSSIWMAVAAVITAVATIVIAVITAVATILSR